MVKSSLLSTTLSSTQNSVLSAASILAVAYGVSAILSFIKLRLLASYFGASTEHAIFITSDLIPSIIYSVIAAGTLSSVFIPIFADEMRKNRDEAYKSASNILSITMLIFAVLSLIAAVLAPQIIKLISSGQYTSGEIELGARLMRILFIGQLFLILSGFISSILQSFKMFLVPALGPVFYNLGMIAGLVLLADRLGIYAPAYGAFIGAFLNLLILLPSIKAVGFKFTPGLRFTDRSTLKMLALTPPRILSVGISEMAKLANYSITLMVSTGSIVAMKFATQLQTFPVTLFGASIALAALPSLSCECDTKDLTTFKKTFLNSFFQIMFLTVPAAVILLVLRVAVVRLVYGADKLPWTATLETALILGVFSVSIFAQSAGLLITRAFYATKDTVTPLVVGLCSVSISIVVSYLMVAYYNLGAWSVAASMTVTSYLDASLLLYILAGKVGGFSVRELAKPFTKIVLSAIAMGLSLYVPMKFLDIRVLDTTRTVNLIILVAIVGTAGMVSYLFFTKIFRVEEIELFYKLLRKLRLKSALSPETPIISAVSDEEIN